MHRVPFKLVASMHVRWDVHSRSCVLSGRVIYCVICGNNLSGIVSGNLINWILISFGLCYNARALVRA